MEFIQKLNTVLKNLKYKRYTIWPENSCKSKYGTVDEERGNHSRKGKVAEAFFKQEKCFSQG